MAAGPGPPAEHVGILALEVYFPAQYVDQAALEAFDGVPAGKYTVGLAQAAMAFCDDREDVVSMSMTAVQRLMEKYGISPQDIGRLEVGTESAVDRSKSVKTFLMALFSESGNHDIEGVDNTNACYGGTAALHNAVNWVESRCWDGRLAVVVAADIAAYAEGPARPSGGCGAVAMLIGPNAPLALDRSLGACHMEHAYDFYKPCGIYPQVDGGQSVLCYMKALDKCYAALRRKADKHRGHATQHCNGQASSSEQTSRTRTGPDHDPTHQQTSQREHAGNDVTTQPVSLHGAHQLFDISSQPTGSDGNSTPLDLSAADALVTGLVNPALDEVLSVAAALPAGSDAFVQPQQPLLAGTFVQPKQSVLSSFSPALQEGAALDPVSSETVLVGYEAPEQPSARSICSLSAPEASTSGREAEALSLQSFDYVVMHSPYSKLVRKALARLVYHDGVAAQARQQGQHAGDSRVSRDGMQSSDSMQSLLERFALDPNGGFSEASYCDRGLQEAMLQASAAVYDQKVLPSTLLARQCGNLYTGSLYAGLASLVHTKGASLAGSRILLYSYGSGLAAGMFAVLARHTPGPFSLTDIQRQGNLQNQLATRTCMPPADFASTLETLERRYSAAGYTPQGSGVPLAPGTYYLERVDEKYRRTYGRIPLK